ncbi:leptin receptor-like [Carcharodon carcharias]|uniref:leptin receptor-like n=1 Tax=Carcharodon carcharias TaxID=13397 RepID=UPI001B7E0E68|nr:leptin receptor-like [Carcharodon carcharias]
MGLHFHNMELWLWVGSGTSTERRPRSGKWREGVSISSFAYDPVTTFEIPASNFTMLCTLHKQAAVVKGRSWQLHPRRNSNSRHSWLHEHVRNANTSRSNSTSPKGLHSQDGFSCCLWKEADMHCPAHFITEQSIRMNIKCWTAGDFTQLVCDMKPSDWKIKKLVNCRMYHLNALSFDQKEGNLSMFVSNCYQQHTIKCIISSIDLNRKYFMWIELITNSETFQSSLMFVTPINVVKTNPPLNLQTEMTSEGFFKLSWTGPNPEPYLVQFEVKYSTGTPERVWKVKDVWENSLILRDLQSDLSYLVVVRCKCRSGPGFWSDWSNPIQLDVQGLFIFGECAADSGVCLPTELSSNCALTSSYSADINACHLTLGQVGHARVPPAE